MTGIEKINIRNSLTRQNLKKVLGYAVKERNGYYNQLHRIDDFRGATLDQFKSVGFINTGHTLKQETFSITDLGDQYYKDVFGKLSYWKKRISGACKRFRKNLFK